ncbi:unnamed protein product [Diamesa tonsa]
MDPFKIIRNFILKPVFAMGLYTYEEYKNKTQRKLISTQNWILRVFLAFVVIVLFVCAAVLMYALFYLTYMPSITHIKPVYMQYNKICDDKVNDRSCYSDGVKDSIMSPYHSFPSAHVQLSKKQLLMVGQPYIITVKIDLPETPRNQDQGMFMVCLSMKDQSSILKSHGCRSTMLHYRSPLLQKVKTIVYMPLYVLGIYEQKQELDVEMYSNYVDDATNPVTDVYVEIQSKVIEFYSVTLHITAHFTGLRYIMFHFPVLSALVGIAGNLMFIVMIGLLCWYHWDHEMEWIEEAKKKYAHETKATSKTSDDDQNMEFSQHTTDKSYFDDENLSILEYNESDSNCGQDDDDDNFLFDRDMPKPSKFIPDIQEHKRVEE